MARMTVVLLVLAMAACLLVEKPAMVSAQIRDCGQVVARLLPCLTYVFTDGQGLVPCRCCAGVRTVNSLARDTGDRRLAYTFLSNLLSTVNGINQATLAGLPARCSVNLPFTISSNIDCNSIP